MQLDRMALLSKRIAHWKSNGPGCGLDCTSAMLILKCHFYIRNCHLKHPRTFWIIWFYQYAPICVLPEVKQLYSQNNIYFLLTVFFAKWSWFQQYNQKYWNIFVLRFLSDIRAPKPFECLICGAGKKHIKFPSSVSEIFRWGSKKLRNKMELWSI